MSPQARKRRRLDIPSEENIAPKPTMLDNNPDTAVAQLYKNDLESIRATVTCSVCDQLLYEPWTLGCGHTYCYSCLCSWFTNNRHKKTCPDCRTIVSSMPASSFLLKNIVQVFCNRPELLPKDETIAEHNDRRRKESEALEIDKLSAEGLFRGCFRDPIKSLVRDEADQVVRCAVCGTEWEGEPACQNCGVHFDGDEQDFDSPDDGFSDEDSINSSGEEHSHYHDPHLYEGFDHGTVLELREARRMAYGRGETTPSVASDSSSLDGFVVRDGPAFAIDNYGRSATHSVESSVDISSVNDSYSEAMEGVEYTDSEEAANSEYERPVPPYHLQHNDHTIAGLGSSPPVQSPGESHISIPSSEEQDRFTRARQAQGDWSSVQESPDEDEDDDEDRQAARTHVWLDKSPSIVDDEEESEEDTAVNRRARLLHQVLGRRRRRAPSSEEPTNRSSDNDSYSDNPGLEYHGGNPSSGNASTSPEASRGTTASSQFGGPGTPEVSLGTSAASHFHGPGHVLGAWRPRESENDSDSSDEDIVRPPGRRGLFTRRHPNPQVL